jgi:hypothetical protein
MLRPEEVVRSWADNADGGAQRFCWIYLNRQAFRDESDNDII